jgi:hypothetical protein
MCELVVMDMKDIIDKVEVHVFIHIGLFEALTGDTGCEEEVRLYVDTEPSVFVLRNAPIVVFVVELAVGGRSNELVHLLLGGETV